MLWSTFMMNSQHSVIVSRLSKCGFVPLLALVVSLSWGACQDQTKEPSEPGGQDAVVTSQDEIPPQDSIADDTPKRASEVDPLLAEEIRPRFGLMDTQGKTRGVFAVHFDSALSPKDQTGRLAQGTSLKITPEVKGKLIWATDRRLEFRPAKPLEIGTTYDLELTELTPRGTKGTAIKPPAGRFLGGKVTTDPFSIRSVELDRSTWGKKARADLTLSFNAEPDLGAVKGAIRIRHHESDDAPKDVLKTFTLKTTKNKRSLKLSVPLPQGLSEGRLQLTVGKTARDASGHHRLQTAWTRNFPLTIPGRIKVRSVRVNEERSGFTIVVHCKDDQMKERWEWDDEIGEEYRVGDKCPIAEATAGNFIDISPSVNFNIVNTDHGFDVQGAFKAGTYTITFHPGLVSTKRSILMKSSVTTLIVPRRTPRLAPASVGRYLPRRYLSGLPVTALNASKAKLTVRRIHPQNVGFWLTAQNETATDRISDVVAQRNLRFDSPPDKEVARRLDLDGALGSSSKGVFELHLQANGASSIEKTRIVLTDLVLLAKRFGDQGQHVRTWVVDAHNLTPVASADVQLLSKSNRILKRCRTDRSGTCLFEEIGKGHPIAILVKSKSELTFLEFEDLEIDLSESEVAGRAFQDKQPYTAAVWSDRGVYRPGETAHVGAILRGRNNKAPQAGVPVLAKLYDPKGKLVHKGRDATNDGGLVSFDFDFQMFAPTGPYRADLQIGGKTVESYSFNVEEFVPERMKVTAVARAKSIMTSSPAEIDIEARYLFGALAAEEKVEMSCSVGRGQFKSKDFPKFSFMRRTDKKKAATATLATLEDTLDAKGKITLNCPPAEQATALTGPGELKAMVSVFEAGSGRTTTTSLWLPLHPTKTYVGLSGPTDRQRAGNPVNIQGVLVGHDGQLARTDAPLKIQVIRLQEEWSWQWLTDDAGRRRQSWTTHTREVVEGVSQAAIKRGQLAFSFTPRHSGRYLVRAWHGPVVSDVEIAVGWSYVSSTGSMDRTPKPQRPADMPLDLPKEVEGGAPIVAKFDAPFPGRALVSVETDQLLEHRWIDLSPGQNQIEVKAPTRVPNVYISVLALKDPHAESKEAYLPERVLGLASVKIAPSAHVLKLDLKTPSLVKPNSILKVELQAKGHGESVYATVAAVDEGILSLTRFKTPDVIKQLFPKRKLGVQSFETLGWTLLVPPLSRAKGEGGDGAARGKKGRPMPVKPVALWSGLVKLDKTGKGIVELPVPLYRGELRVMAVAASATRAAAADAQVTVRDPLVLTTTFPRFLISEDQFVVPVFLTNMTGQDGQIEVELNTSRGVRIIGDRKKRITLKKGAKGAVTFVGEATAWRGAAQFKVFAKGAGETSRDEAEIGFIPADPIIREVKAVKLSDGQNMLNDVLNGWAPETENTTVWVTKSQYGEELTHLRYLVRYPYG
jgi:alpha-2-macroglobulin